MLRRPVQASLRTSTFHDESRVSSSPCFSREAQEAPLQVQDSTRLGRRTESTDSLRSWFQRFIQIVGCIDEESLADLQRERQAGPRKELSLALFSVKETSGLVIDHSRSERCDGLAMDEMQHLDDRCGLMRRKRSMSF